VSVALSVSLSPISSICRNNFESSGEEILMERGGKFESEKPTVHELYVCVRDRRTHSSDARIMHDPETEGERNARSLKDVRSEGESETYKAGSRS
jgi:hypothetical protein